MAVIYRRRSPHFASRVGSRRSAFRNNLPGLNSAIRQRVLRDYRRVARAQLRRLARGRYLTQSRRRVPRYIAYRNRRTRNRRRN